MRRSGSTPRVDFQLEAQLTGEQPALTVARYDSGSDAADYLMARYTPAVDWSKAAGKRTDVVVAVDTSAGGDDASRRLETTAAEALLRALAPSDRFALVALDLGAEVLYPAKGLAKAEEGEIAKALEALADHPERGLIDFGIGENDEMAPAPVRRVMAAEINKPANRGYADNGILEFKQAVSRSMARHFHVRRDPAGAVHHSLRPEAAAQPGSDRGGRVDAVGRVVRLQCRQ